MELTDRSYRHMAYALAIVGGFILGLDHYDSPEPRKTVAMLILMTGLIMIGVSANIQKLTRFDRGFKIGIGGFKMFMVILIGSLLGSCFGPIISH